MFECSASVPKQGERPVAVLIGGGTASGKTTLRKTIVKEDMYKMGMNAVIADPDKIKKYIPEYQFLKQLFPDQAEGLVHKESVDICELLVKQLIKKRRNFIYEGTMARTGKYRRLIQELKSKNYKIYLYVADVPLNIAKARADKRGRITGRKIPHHIIENTHRIVPITVEKIKEMVDNYYIFDNRAEPALIASRYYIDPLRYKEFLKKAE
ncbi:MAG TPA: zeta toxin family protein [Bacillota bacterium]|nr:zeta toxin family protein [Bacillota bacterium]